MTSKLTPKTVDALLDRLATDDGFRARFQRNPREATRSLGTGDPAVDTLPETSVGPIADRKTIASSRDRLREQLENAPHPFIPYCLDLPER